MEDSYGLPAWSSSFEVYHPVQDNFETMRYLISKTDRDVIKNLPTLLRSAFYLTPESFKWILQSTEYPIHERSHRERALLVLGISKCRLLHMKELLWLTLDDMDMETCVQNLKQADFFKLLKRIIYCLGFIIANRLVVRRYGSPMAPYGDYLKNHLDITHDLFLAGSKCHHLKDTYKDYHHGFLLPLLMGAFSSFILCAPMFRTNAGFDRLEQCFKSSIETWLDQIISEGIDLIEYGQWEKEIHHVDRFCETTQFTSRASHHKGHDYVISFLTSTYGPKRSDWQFWFTIEPKCINQGCVKEFWDMAENPERQIPGAWNFDA
ncbi:hypothetical protein BPAE_0007g00990 [Botrytis paeoniae]|uniref:Uncharacterized protein n=1 Tax=Botrytis paeoniae TaxID=278948 RepID=A0A4Z1G384_9HELO|nr:hypothetical protein BPAE_0007g00990 [Botrytis paeoniae]